MSVNKVSPSQTERNVGHGHDSNSDQRNKGVPLVAKTIYKPVVETRPEVESIAKGDTTKWILKNIKVNTCLCNEESEEKNICHCGNNQEKHARNVESQHNKSNTETTNAFGEITFDRKYTAKYIRVDSNTTNPTTVLKIMEEKWKLKMPNLLISVAGNMKKFENSSLANACLTSLMKAVQGTGAWIITDGKQVFVNTDETVVSPDEQPVIGITSWGTIHSKQQLVNQQGTRPAEHHIEKISLDPYHSHFILTDDRRGDRSATKTTFREELESEITKIKKSDNDVPVVLIVFEWDNDISRTVFNALERKIPVVIVKASDKEAYGTETESEIPEDISSRTHICEWNSDSSDLDIGLAILHALSKDTSNNLLGNMTDSMYQLKLAFARNIFGIENISKFTRLQADTLESCMMAAILCDRVEFVEQMLDKYFDRKTFLTHKRLQELYETEPEKSFFEDLLSKIRKEEPKNTLEDVEKLLENLLGDSNLQLKRYPNIDKDTHTPERKQVEQVWSTNFYFCKTWIEEDVNDIKCFYKFDGHEQKISDDDDQCLDLFVWSVLNNRQNMAKLFWRHVKDPMAAALFAHALLSAMSDEIDDKDFKEQCEQQRREFTNLAIGVLRECHKKGMKQAKALLIHEQSKWQKTSCVLIAVKSENKQFIADHACQDVFNTIWMGEINQETGSLCNNLKLLLCIVFPWLILYWLKFKDKEDSEQARDDPKASDTVQADSNSKQPAHRGENNTNVSSQQKQQTNNFHIRWQKISSFYTAPVIICFHNVISYMLFLSLYSYILISKFDRYLSWQEILLCVWVFTIFTQEIIQVCTTPSKDWKSRFCNYIKDGWNILDIVTLFLFLSGMILRIFDHPQVSESAHIVLGVNLITFYLRLLHIFSVHRELGPKLVMIFHMVINLAYFVMILLVFIVAYGIASHAILYPHTEPSLETLTEIFRRPYWNIYGELMLDKIEGSVDCTNDPELYKTGTYSRCPTESGKYFVPVLMGVYMLMCNILLLNLLIAMFSITFQKVQDNSYLYWSFQQYSLINEYYNRPFLAPPLIIIVHLLWLIRREVSAAGLNAFYKEIQIGTDLRTEEKEIAKKIYINRMGHNSTIVSEAGSANWEKRMEKMEKQLNLIVKTMRENNRAAKME